VRRRPGCRCGGVWFAPGNAGSGNCEDVYCATVSGPLVSGSTGGSECESNPNANPAAQPAHGTQNVPIWTTRLVSAPDRQAAHIGGYLRTGCPPVRVTKRDRLQAQRNARSTRGAVAFGCPADFDGAGWTVIAQLRPTAGPASPRWRITRRAVGACRSRSVSFPRCTAPRPVPGPCRPSRTRSPSQWRVPESAPAPVGRPAEAPQLRARRAR
jgi:hypothetical protein